MQNWYLGDNTNDRYHIFFDQSCYEDFVKIIEGISELDWIENLEPNQLEAWKEKPQFYKTNAIVDYNLHGKVNPYGLDIWYDKVTNRIIASPRTIKNQRSVEIIFDIAEALNAKVYEGSTPRTKEKYMQRYEEGAKESRKIKNEEKRKLKPEKKTFWNWIVGK